MSYFAYYKKGVLMGTMTFDFSGEVVLVTGGSRGLGLEIAQAFGKAGDRNG